MDAAMEKLNRLAMGGPGQGGSGGSPETPLFSSALVASTTLARSITVDSSTAASASATNGAGKYLSSSHSFNSYGGADAMDVASWDGSAVMKKQAGELEAVLRAKSELEVEVRSLSSELHSVKNRSLQKDSELKQMEAQLRQKSARISALEAGTGAAPLPDSESSELMDMKAERDALQDALMSAQLELAKEQAVRTNLEAKVASLSSSAAHPREQQDNSGEVAILRDQLAAEQAEVAALQESLRRAENEWNASYQEAFSLKEAKARAEAKCKDSQADIEQLKEQAEHMRRLMESKDRTVQELTDKLEKRLIENLQFDGSGKLSEDEMWKLGLTHEQMSAIDSIIETWREAYSRKDQEVMEVATLLRDQEEQVARISGIVKRAMDSILSSYQRSSREGSPTKDTSHDESLLDTSQFSTVEDMLGSLAQFAANKSHAVLRLEQELGRRAQEIRQLEDELQESWAASKKESEVERLKKELADVTAECNELRVALSHRNEDCAAAHVEVRVLHEEVQAAREQANELRRELAGVEDELARLRHESSSNAAHEAARMREELEKAHGEVLPLKEQLNRRTREVRELNHMLKAWEAMRLGKDAQIASLMERCKRHEEEAAEKARSVDSLRRKLALAGRDPGVNSPSASGRARHIHVHMHQQPTDSGSEYEYGMQPG
eukprot:CAMPEP_0117675320 /NCGR_PEP_ID=MMETSP0804-20121206/15539_1 /TAXON_ID=1074897 /ORGANISM="Tetraselmis astigmatica, Strain CCMP880" /LENGTH=667 /DNA_ID=CAMNT_0005484309 /DNA_START=212 /DNA_END=2211 /DNA_ORIENTATION=-